MKLCKDCKHHRDSDSSGQFDRCFAPKNLRFVNLVTGSKSAKFSFCEIHRSPPLAGWLGSRLSGSCGKAGRWFEPK